MQKTAALNKKIALFGWGTGGHITPLLTLREELITRWAEVFWLGEKWAMDEEMARKYEVVFYGIITGKLRRYFDWRTLATPFRMIGGFAQALSILAREKPDIAFSKWWAIAVPAVLAAWILRVPIYAHESDTIPWLANRIAGRFARRIFVGFEGAKKFFPDGKTEVVGQILNPIFSQFARRTPKSSSDWMRLLVIWGSQWARCIFEAILAHRNPLRSYQITIVLGKLNSHMRAQFQDWENVTCVDFATPQELVEIYANTDIAITRASGTTMSEMSLFGIKMLMIPLEVASFNHQYYNALEFQKYGHTILSERSLITEEFVRSLTELSQWDLISEGPQLDGRDRVVREILNGCK